MVVTYLHVREDNELYLFSRHIVLLVKMDAKVPAIIKFAFSDFVENKCTNKWSAKCIVCRSVFTETIGVTSGFTK